MKTIKNSDDKRFLGSVDLLGIMMLERRMMLDDGLMLVLLKNDSQMDVMEEILEYLHGYDRKVFSFSVNNYGFDRVGEFFVKLITDNSSKDERMFNTRPGSVVLMCSDGMSSATNALKSSGIRLRISSKGKYDTKIKVFNIDRSKLTDKKVVTLDFLCPSEGEYYKYPNTIQVDLDD